MKISFSHFLVSLVLKLKGVKKTFSKSPIDYKKLRKEDIKFPKESLYKQANRFTILKTTITELASTQESSKLLLYIHGGAFVSGPVKHHWDSLKTIYKKTNHTIWMCDYPKAPETKITAISKNIDAVYQEALKKYQASNITIIGDSVGGTLSVALIQRLINNKEALPSKIVLITPVMDATMSNPEITEVDKKDLILSKEGVLSAKKMCAENNNLKAVNISPINGNFKGFPTTILFLAEYDIMYPDQLKLVDKLVKSNITMEIFTGKKMPHIWPLLPVLKEGKQALNTLINRLNN